MKSRKTNRRILYLMILSQVLLTVFVLQWIRSQYLEEKERLSDELTSLYIEAQDEMVDTILFKSYVSPVLTLSDDSIHERLKGTVRWEGEKGRVMVSVNHAADSGRHFPDTVRLRKTNDDMLIRSVKLIISHSRDTLRSDAPLIKNFRLTPDTLAFKEHFHSRLDNAGLKFNLLWIKDSANGKNLRKTIYLAPLNPFSLPSVTIKNFSGYLTGKILPQILFGVLLICLTAIAFLISYRSLRDHVLLSSMRDEFISNMTHELKTPVASISLAMESLSRYNLRSDPAVLDEYLKLALSETRRLEDLVNRVLDNAALEGDIQTIEPVVTDLNILITEVVSTMRSRIRDTGNIDFFPSEEKLMVMCDPLLFKGVIMNLIDNSIKYSGESPAIRLYTEMDKHTAKITVSDDGPGIPAEYHEKVFEKFFRVPSGNVHNVKGYGLGLNFALKVMTLHEGSIVIKNKDKGCSFILNLPLS